MDYEICDEKVDNKNFHKIKEDIKDTCDIENYVKFYIASKMDD